MKYYSSSWLATMLLLNDHYCAISCPPLCHYCVTTMALHEHANAIIVTYETLLGYNIGIILQLDGHYGATT